MKFIPVAIIAFILLILPGDMALAQSGLVACGNPGQPVCGSCEFVSMANEIINWLIAILFMVFAVMMVVAGFGLITSGGNQSALDAAKSKFTNAIVGIIIVLAAWLIVDTVMSGLVGGGETGQPMGELRGWGPWSRVLCTTQTPAQAGPTPAPGGGVVATTTATTTPGLCEVAPLSPITDTLAQRMEAGNGNAVIWENTDPRLRVCASRAGGTVTSAYRPPSYQTHLREIHTRWCSQGLMNNTNPACSAIRSEVSGEMSRHGLSCSRPVATNSNHSAGIAVDISGAPQRDMPEICLDWFGPGDPVHYTLMSGCSCD